MKYEGPLYGKIGRRTFDTGKTSHDWDGIERENALLKAANSDVKRIAMERNKMRDALGNQATHRSN